MAHFVCDDTKSPLRNKVWFDVMVPFVLRRAEERRQHERMTERGNQRNFDLQKYSQSAPQASFFKSPRWPVSALDKTNRLSLVLERLALVSGQKSGHVRLNRSLTRSPFTNTLQRNTEGQKHTGQEKEPEQQELRMFIRQINRF